MEKNKKKPATAASRKGAKGQSAYKSREADGKPGQFDGQFQKAFGKAKDAPRKG